MTDPKTQAVVEAAQKATRSMGAVAHDGGRRHILVLEDACEQLRTTVAALDSPLPSDAELRDIGNSGGFTEGGVRRALYARACRDCADHIGRREATSFTDDSETFRGWADEMESR